jgi:hypothetical protein
MPARQLAQPSARVKAPDPLTWLTQRTAPPLARPLAESCLAEATVAVVVRIPDVDAPSSAALADGRQAMLACDRAAAGTLSPRRTTDRRPAGHS